MKLECRVKKFSRELDYLKNCYNEAMARMVVESESNGMNTTGYWETRGKILALKKVIGKFYDNNLPWDYVKKL